MLNTIKKLFPSEGNVNVKLNINQHLFHRRCLTLPHVSGIEINKYKSPNYCLLFVNVLLTTTKFGGQYDFFFH